ncbi:hypothetical protein CDAR_71371 [Caerostris darwini]|uniref:Uncharacterized protein n=1 Tax=Caerostris darwini TaxID=1538125 RepID=A0AAV4WDV1_9ARAC|nr:hypothetical protein CDAR_71371 [Caerostris darwini]
MSLVGRCYSLEEAAGSSGDDDSRNVHHIILMLQSERAGQRFHLLRGVIPLKKQQKIVETTTAEMKSRAKMSLVGRCYSLEEATGNSGDDDSRNVHIILMLQSGRAGRRCHLLGYVIPLKKQQETVETTTAEMFIISF